MNEKLGIFIGFLIFAVLGSIIFGPVYNKQVNDKYNHDHKYVHTTATITHITNGTYSCCQIRDLQRCHIDPGLIPCQNLITNFTEGTCNAGKQCCRQQCQTCCDNDDDPPMPLNDRRRHPSDLRIGPKCYQCKCTCTQWSDNTVGRSYCSDCFTPVIGLSYECKTNWTKPCGIDNYLCLYDFLSGRKIGSPVPLYYETTNCHQIIFSQSKYKVPPALIFAYVVVGIFWLIAFAFLIGLAVEIYKTWNYNSF